MGSKVEACAECTRNCSMIHWKHDPSPIVFSFFKVMYGKHFSEVLAVPPRFIRLASLASQKTYLEDSSGQKWNVVLSKLNGSLVFKDGWDEFSVYHGIELGDFVVFHYIKSSHFVVQIFGKNGCEKLSFSGVNRNQNKRAKTTKDLNVRNELHDSVHELPPNDGVNARTNSQPDITVTQSERNSNIRAKLPPTKDHPEDPCFKIYRDTSSAREDDRSHLFDLSTFEMLDDKASTVHIQGNKCFSVSDTVALHNTEITPASNDFKKSHIAQGNPVANSNYNTAMVPRNECSPSPFSLPRIGMLPSSNLPQIPNGIRNPSYTSTAPGEKQRIFKQEAKHSEDYNPVAKSLSSNYSWLPSNLCNSAKARISTGVFVERCNMMRDKGNMIIKSEAKSFDPFDASPTLLITEFGCSVKRDNESFLELPKSLPIKACKQGANLEQKLVLLRDPSRRLWPVVYHQSNGRNVLASGWKAFRKANRIQPGDECTFVLENIYESIFQVQIHHC